MNIPITNLKPRFCWTGNGCAYGEWNTSVYIFQDYSGKLSTSLKIFQQMLKQLFERNKIFAQIVFQVYLDFNNAHTHWYKQRLFISSQNVHSLFWVRGSFGFVNFWNPWRFEERDQICSVLIPWQESCADIKFLSFPRNIKTQQHSLSLRLSKQKSQTLLGSMLR